MSPILLLSLAGIACITRLVAVLRLWKAPREKGESWFLAQPVGTLFYAGIGAGLERSIHGGMRFLRWVSPKLSKS